MMSALVEDGLSPEDARARLWFVDVKGLVTKTRTDLLPHNLPYAHDHASLGFVDAIDAVKPHVLIGATGAPVIAENIRRFRAGQPVHNLVDLSAGY